jgi:nitrogen regulatory protein PII
MTFADLTRMTRVDVVVEARDTDLVERLVTDAGAAGFTVLSNVSGLGHGGYREGRLPFNDRDGQTMLFTVVPEGAAAGVVEAVRVLLADRPGVMLVSEAWVSRPEYFEGGAASVPAP